MVYLELRVFVSKVQFSLHSCVRGFLRHILVQVEAQPIYIFT